MKEEQLHIGQLIKKAFKENNSLTITEFAKKIHTSRQNVYSIFKRKKIHSLELLFLIDKALDSNLYQLVYYKRKGRGIDSETIRLLIEVEIEVESGNQNLKILDKIIIIKALNKD